MSSGIHEYTCERRRADRYAQYMDQHGERWAHVRVALAAIGPDATHEQMDQAHAIVWKSPCTEPSPNRRNRCEMCNRHADVLARIGYDPPDYDMACFDVCAECLRHALSIATEPKEDAP